MLISVVLGLTQNEATRIRCGTENVVYTTRNTGGRDVFEDVFVGRCLLGLITFGLCHESELRVVITVINTDECLSVWS